MTGPAPEYGQFMPDKEVAEALRQHVPTLKQLREWTGNFRATPRIQTAIHELMTAIDLLETERHR